MAGYVYLGQTLIGLSTIKKLTNFGGINIAPGPMYYDVAQGEYSICNTYNEHNSIETGVISGNGYTDNYRTLFTYKEIGTKFCSLGSQWEDNVSTISGEHIIDNEGELVSWNGVNDWRLPSPREIDHIVFGAVSENYSIYSMPSKTIKTRNGSTVNNTKGVTSWIVGASGTNNSYVAGLVVFPENKEFTVLQGGELITSGSGFQINGVGSTSKCINISQIETLISQGCVFIPAYGYIFPDADGSSKSSGVTMIPSTYIYQQNVGNQNIFGYWSRFGAIKIYMPGYCVPSGHFEVSNLNNVTSGTEAYWGSRWPVTLIRGNIAS